MPSRSRSASSDELQSPSESPTPTPPADPIPTSPLFTPPRSPDTSSPDPEEPPSWSPDAAEQDAVDSPASSSAPRSTGRARLKALRETLSRGVLIAGGVAHQFLTRPGSLEREHGVWLPDEDDVQAISEPLASLASRRAPEGVANPDTVDLVALAAGVLSYVMKQRARLADLAAAYGPPPAADVEQQDDAEAFA